MSTHNNSNKYKEIAVQYYFQVKFLLQEIKTLLGLYELYTQQVFYYVFLFHYLIMLIMKNLLTLRVHKLKNNEPYFGLTYKPL